MSSTITRPWILNFLISVAEEYGGNLSAARPKKKTAKAQLVKFLTFADPGNTAPCNIWVQISDKKHIIHARLSQDAVARHLEHPIYGGKPISSYKSALVSLERVRVAFGRVPIGESKGMTKDATLFLDVEEFEMKGALGEPMWDSPVYIASDKSIQEWIQGLRQDGGAGNILKQRKENAASIAEQTKRSRTTAAESHVQTTMDAMNVKVRVARKSGPPKPRPSSCVQDRDLDRSTASKEALRKASWKRFHTKVVNYFCPSDDVLEHLFALCGERLPPMASPTGLPKRPGSLSRTGFRSPRVRTRLPSSPLVSRSVSPEKRRISPTGTPQSSPPRSPSQWSPSVRGSPRRLNSDSLDTEEDPEDAYGTDTDSGDAMDKHIVHNTSSTKLGTPSTKSSKVAAEHDSPSLSMPPPLAQPRLYPPPSSVPYATSSPQLPVHSQQQLVTLDDDDVLPPSSLPVPVSSLQLSPHPTSSPQHPTFTPGWSTSGLRRVPPPQVGTLLADPDASGEGRVLVENSDTGSPHSQRVALSQSQSQSQKCSQGQQSQRSSKLRNEVGPVETQAEGNARGSERPEAPNDPDGLAAPELEKDSQESAKSRQSLSYKGDSQSQDKPGVAQPAPDTEVQVTIEAEEHEVAMVVDGANEALNVGANDAGDGDPQPEQTRLSPRMSPMSVDPDQPAPPGALNTITPTWAAIRATTSPENEDDSEDDVDELLSDPLGFQQETLAPARRAQRRKAKAKAATAGKKRLDSDDERTAAMVEQYVERINPAAQKPGRSGTRQSSPAKRPRQSTPVIDEQPQGRKLKRRKQVADDEHKPAPSLPPGADVFTGESSCREEALEASATKHVQTRLGLPPASAQEARKEDHHQATADRDRRPDANYPAHDSSVWTAPSFMRKRDKPTQGVSKAPVSVAGSEKAGLSRRRVSGMSSLADEEQPAPKKQKTSSVAIPVSAKPRRFRPDTATKADFTRDPRTSIREPRLHSHSGPTASSSTLPLPAAAYPQESGIHTGSNGSRASRAGSGGSNSAPFPHASHAPASAASKGKAAMRPVKREEVDTLSLTQALPALPGAKGLSSRQPAAAHRRVPSTQSGTAGPGQGLRGLQDDRADATRSLVNEHRASHQQTRAAGGPPFLGWDDLLEILLETGRARTEASRGASSRGAGSS